MVTTHTRPTLILVAITVLELSDYATISAPERAQATAWLILSAILLWRLWRGGLIAWSLLVGFLCATLLVANTHVLHSTLKGTSLLWWTTISVAELLLLLMPQVRRWTGSNHSAD